MAQKLQYDLLMKGLNRIRRGASLTAITALMAMLTRVPSLAQTANGVPASVTSIGFGGHGNRPQGLPPSVTSPGFSQSFTRFGTVPGRASHSHHRSTYGYGGAYYFPYAYPYVVDGPPDGQLDEDFNSQPDGPYAGGPTIFDRRGSGPAPEPRRDSSADQSLRSDPAALAQPQAESPPAPTPTVLVFKDGHQVEVANYAIVGTTLYDLNQGRRSKILLSDLDLTATATQNDQRGIDFQIPATLQAN